MKQVRSSILSEFAEGVGEKKALKHEYSDGIENKTIAILGNYPPPLGGVSVHIKRVMHKFTRQCNRVHHFDTSKRFNVFLYVIRLCFFLVKNRFDLVYYHTADLNRRFVEFKLLLFLKKIMGYELVIVEHNCRHLAQRSKASKKIFNQCMQKADKLVLIGSSTWQSYIDHDIHMPVDTTIEAAFLPPDLTTESYLIEGYPATLKQFLQTHSPVIIINAFQLSFIGDQDLYGIDLSIDALAKISKKHPTVGIVYAFAQIGDQEYFNSLKDKLSLLHLNSFVYFLIGQNELWPLLKNADLLMRPTRSDGESVSVQEALYFNIPVVASDAIERPRRVFIFKSGNAESLYEKIDQVLSEKLKENVYGSPTR